MQKSLLALAGAASLILASSCAYAGENFVDALKAGKPILEMRYRFEYVDQEGLPNTAKASTLGTRAGYETGYFYHVKGLAELENVTVLGPDLYNDTLNRKTTYPTVNDPEATEINQLYLTTDIVPKTLVSVGRQRITLDNGRFVGRSSWRQNEQTYDAVRLVNNSLSDTKVNYAYIEHVNRALGDRSALGEYRSNIHLANLSYSGVPYITLGGYGYFMDLRNAKILSNKTFGARGEGKYRLNNSQATLTYLLEFANQTDYANNPASYSQNYYRVEPGLEWQGISASIGIDMLGGNGKNAVQLPIATNHQFDGWANKFSSFTPVNGLQDRFITAGYNFGKNYAVPYLEDIAIKAEYHDFASDRASIHYGEEWDFNITKKFAKKYTLTLEYNNYLADKFATDTQKAVVMLGYVY